MGERKPSDTLSNLLAQIPAPEREKLAITEAWLVYVEEKRTAQIITDDQAAVIKFELMKQKILGRNSSGESSHGKTQPSSYNSVSVSFGGDAMAQGDNRSVSVGGDVSSSRIVTGDHDTTTTELKQVTLPPAESVDVAAELAELRGALMALEPPEAGKVAKAIDQAADEVASAEPDKEEMAGRVERAVKLAQQAESFSGHVAKIAPRVVALASWLGEHGKRLLPLVGLAG